MFHIRGDGEIYARGNCSMNSFDQYCDAQVVRTLDYVYENPGVVKSKWDDFVKYNECTLVDMGILSSSVSRPNEHGGHGMLNITGLLRLHNGAIWQLHSRLSDQAEELAALKGQLQPLQEGK